MKTKRKKPESRAVDATGKAISQRVQAFERFRQCILAAKLLPGQFVSQRELMQLLGMSLAAVREMIPRLEAARLIRTVPKRGLQIAHVDLKLIRNAFQVRAMIEREAVVHFLRVVSDEELAEIEQQHRAILARADSGESDEALNEAAEGVDWGLHDRMVDSIGNDILSEMYRINSMHVRLIRLDAHQIRPMRVVPAMHEHLAFIEALRARDEARAVNMLLDHIESSRQRVLAAILDREPVTRHDARAVRPLTPVPTASARS
jgi:DNA-binding GntR family transcriptional regulator